MVIVQTLKGSWLGSPSFDLVEIEVIQAFMDVVIICKNEGDPIKIEYTRVVTVIYIDFSDAQGQLTP